MVGFRCKWLAGLVVGAVLAVSPSVASADLIHSALYDWFDVDDDLIIDYVRVSVQEPAIDNFIFDMNLNVVEVDLSDFSPLVEVLQKFWDGPQGNDSVNPDFQWSVFRDEDSLPEFSSFHVFHDVGGFAIVNPDTGNLGGNNLEWAFSQTDTSLDWEADDDDDTLINGVSGEFRASVRPGISWEYGFAAVNWFDEELQETRLLFGITSVPTPEPTTLLLAGMALPFGVLGYRRRQRLAKNA